ncbi:MAG: hypothetical protein L0Y55_19660 [Anaerolineales bacterium]|nr:hypothetical protein [Anaerolineales bacterium]
MASLEQRNLPIPELTYLILPPYEIPDLIVMGGVVIENRGDAPAHNVKIVLEFADTDTTKIRHLQVLSDVEYILRGGGELQSFATLRVRRLAPGQRIVIYFSGPNRVQPRVTATHYEG